MKTTLAIFAFVVAAAYLAVLAIEVPSPDLVFFIILTIGFIGYEFIHDIEPVVPRPPADDLGTPTKVFHIADELLVFDRLAYGLRIVAAGFFHRLCPEMHGHVSGFHRI